MPIGNGTYAIDANGAKGELVFQHFLTDDPSVQGGMSIDPGFSDPISVTWSQSTNEITIRREVQKFPGLVQTYHGYPFDTQGSILDSRFVAYPNDSRPAFAGYFEQSDTPGVRFGWVAVFKHGIIT